MVPSQQPIVMSTFDFRRLEQLCALLRARPRSVSEVEASLSALESELGRAEVVLPQRVPAEVVTMNSEVLLSDLDTGEQRSVKLVFPGSRRDQASSVSVFSPIGMALLGSRERAELRCPAPGRVCRLRVDRMLYQPEAAGHFEL